MAGYVCSVVEIDEFYKIMIMPVVHALRYMIFLNLCMLMHTPSKFSASAQDAAPDGF